nr:trafficking protein particle complex subunit 12 [Ipomoea batatas]
MDDATVSADPDQAPINTAPTATADADSGAATATATTIDDPLNNPYGSLNDHCHELGALQDLACRGAWRSILDKIGRARSLSLLTKPHEHLIYLTYNVLALTKLRRFSDAGNELNTVLEGDDFETSQYLYETYPNHYPNSRGSMVPFALRWLHAHLPSTLGQRQQALDRLYTLLDFIRSKKLNDLQSRSKVSEDLWRKREIFVINTIISYHLSQKEFKVCSDLLNEVIGKRECGNDPFLVSKLGYVQMQYGDLEGAKTTFKVVEDIIENEDDVRLKNLVSRNKALIYILGKDYVSAVREYEECIERDGMDIVAFNNKALCLMYLRDLSDAIKVLENALERVPTVALNETVVVNLCSMYELAYVNHVDIKKTLNNWIARVAPDDFDSTCTRI